METDVPHIHTAQEAEVNAAVRMRELGFVDARVTAAGPDGGIDVSSSRALAQVKWRGGMVGRQDLQALYGARGQDISKKLLFFAASDYSKPAIDYADRNQIALFIYEPIGTLVARNKCAATLVLDGPHRKQSFWSRVLWPTLTAIWSLAVWPLMRALWTRWLWPFFDDRWRLISVIAFTAGACAGITVVVFASSGPLRVFGTVLLLVSVLNMPVAWWIYLADRSRAS